MSIKYLVVRTAMCYPCVITIFPVDTTFMQKIVSFGGEHILW